VPDLVVRAALHPALALNAKGNNVARAIGRALGAPRFFVRALL
jgi:hypothetical protein